MKKEIKISFSEYRLFRSCPFRHYLQRVLKLEEPPSEILIFGSALHNSIEEIVKTKKRNIFFEAIFRKQLNKESKGFLTEEKIKLFSYQGVKLLNTLNFFRRFQGWEVVAVEHEFWHPIEETDDYICYFKGFADLILKNIVTQKYLIIDWKSSMKPWDIDKKKEDKTFFGQVALYRHFFSQEKGIPKEQIDTQFITLSRFGDIPMEIFQINISDEFEKFILTDIKKAASEINTFTEYKEKAKFMNTPDSSCKWCNFDKNPCNDTEVQILPAMKSE